MKTIRDFNLSGKRVLVRTDFNVPLDDKGNILDDFRIERTIPTIEYLIEKEAKVILMHHLGSPEGKVVPNLKVDKIQEKLTEYLDLSVIKAPDCVGEGIEKHTKEMMTGEILLLENLKFRREEIAGDLKFAKKLSRLGDIYINDAFGTCHRNYASIVGVPLYLPSGIGFLVKEEIKNLKKIRENPKKPLVAVIGGKKVESKTKVINDFLGMSALVLVGDLIEKEIKEKNIPIFDPQKLISPVDSIEKNLDIGPETIKLFEKKIKKAKTVFWAGPLGKIEKEKYSKGTLKIAQAIIESGAFSVVGGGDTVEFLNKKGLSSKFNHVSTGGGAMLTFLAEGKLVGIEVLKK